MIASQIAITACLGCVPIGKAADTPKIEWSEASIEYEMTRLEEVTAPAELSSLTPRLSSSNTSPSEWAISDEMIAVQIQEENTPRPLRFEPAELFTAEMQFTARGVDTGLGLDMSVTPRWTLEKRGQFHATRAGAEVRVGRGLEQALEAMDQRGERIDIESWYLFAATDGEALCWDVGDKGATIDGVALRDQVTVGDVQAGFAVQKGGGELSVGYVRREYSSEHLSTTENFAAVSFTMRR